MKVLVLNNMVPWTRGGAEDLAEHLVTQLRGSGHQAELLKIPFNWQPAERLVDEMLVCRGMRLVNVDKVIALKFPAYLVPFENKTFWLIHQFRQAYDLWDAGESHIPHSPHGNEIRNAILEADNQAFSHANKIYCIGTEVQDRLLKYNGIRSNLLRHPLNDPHLFRYESSSDYIFAGGRINSGKRQHRLIEALARTKSAARLVVAGPADSANDAHRLREAVQKLGLQDRVKLDIGFLPRERIVSYVNNCLASAYLPFNEDSFGYVTMEACQAGKPVMTLNDSGDLTRLISEGETGYVCDDDLEQIADRIDRLWMDRSRTLELGKAAHANWIKMDVNWETTVSRLME